jgi:hypothetical protein
MAEASVISFGIQMPARASEPHGLLDERGFLSAPEKTRTSTDQSVHKALNPNRPV